MTKCDHCGLNLDTDCEIEAYWVDEGGEIISTHNVCRECLIAGGDSYPRYVAVENNMTMCEFCNIALQFGRIDHEERDKATVFAAYSEEGVISSQVYHLCEDCYYCNRYDKFLHAGLVLAPEEVCAKARADIDRLIKLVERAMITLKW